MAKGVRPQLSLNLRASLKVDELLEVAGTLVQEDSQLPPPLPAKPSAMSSLSLWHIETQFKFKVVSAANVNAGDDMKVITYFVIDTTFCCICITMLLYNSNINNCLTSLCSAIRTYKFLFGSLTYSLLQEHKS